jgi:hypothetical protein
MGNWVDFLFKVATVYFLWQQNRILAKAEPLMSATRFDMLREKLQRYWPMVVMVALTAGIWAQPYFAPIPEGERLPLVVTVAADLPSNETLVTISNQTFDGGDIPLDGHIYENCTFTNHACLLYDGGPYRLENATFQTHPHLCAHTQALKNYLQLQEALKLTETPLHNRTLVPWWTERP